MPFVNQEHRDNPDRSIPGDRCFLQYQSMMSAWRVSPRWTTIDKMAATIWPDEWQRATILAFIVFMGFVGMPYEERKKEENGEI